MGRMHTPGKGISKSARPYKRSPPSWQKVSPQDVEEHVCRLAKKGMAPSQVRERERNFIHVLAHDTHVHTHTHTYTRWYAEAAEVVRAHNAGSN